MSSVGLAPNPRCCAGFVTSDIVCRFPRLPAPLVGKVDPWGPPGPELRLMQGIKAVLDPGAVFSPGRFLGGI